MVGKTLNHLAKKLSGEEGEAKNKQRVIHDPATNRPKANPCHKRKGSMVWEDSYTFRQGEEHARYNTDKQRGQTS